MLKPVLERDIGWMMRDALTDPDLASLRGDPRFQAMVATARARLAAKKPADGAAAEFSQDRPWPTASRPIPDPPDLA